MKKEICVRLGQRQPFGPVEAVWGLVALNKLGQLGIVGR
jgi:hypothetical protein